MFYTRRYSLLEAAFGWGQADDQGALVEASLVLYLFSAAADMVVDRGTWVLVHVEVAAKLHLRRSCTVVPVPYHLIDRIAAEAWDAWEEVRPASLTWCVVAAYRPYSGFGRT